MYTIRKSLFVSEMVDKVANNVTDNGGQSFKTNSSNIANYCSYFGQETESVVQLSTIKIFRCPILFSK